MTVKPSDSVGIAWPLALAFAAILGTLATACMMPFVAVATLAGATMPRAQALVTVAGVWAVNQLLGFAMLGYPFTAYAMVWGLALGAASVVAMLVARRTIGDAAALSSRLVAVFAFAFAAYEGFLFLFSLLAGGTGTFAPSIVLQILANDALWLSGLVAFYTLLARAAPRLFGPALAPRLR
ncbi:hypothetical protein [Sphingomonas sp. M1-B02]|uniref:hypothetical protein n=1 Tax=Sphingomonas sp. M1-B02 TaxID=3114300 RepID=UPI0022401464|nr:hypothetical protein [Sphingomonas sp. S6-11]UZK64930.1 hypothetical protein OKW87_10395 [Sphingomonas sp. S6-11]